MNATLLGFASFFLVALAAFAAFGWLVAFPLPEESSPKVDPRTEEFLPLHAQHLPQLRQALDLHDGDYVRRKASPELHKKWREERRRILVAFLKGLAEDFARLDRLGRMIASLSPKLRYRDELERLSLNVRFRLNFRLIRYWILVGGPGPLSRLSYLTSILGRLSARTEGAMARLEMRPS